MTSTSAMTRRSTLIAAFALCSMLGACGSGKGSDTNTAQAAEATMVPSGSVTTPLGGSPANAPAFSRSETLQVTSKTIREKVAHPSSGLLVIGIVCRPNEVGRFPILMYQHAGFSGVGSDASGEGLCQYMADRGYAVFMLSFRGEDGSQGRVEYCGGEVEDTLQMLAIARNQSYVAADPELVEFIGQATANLALHQPVPLAIELVRRCIPPKLWRIGVVPCWWSKEPATKPFRQDNPVIWFVPLEGSGILT